MTHKNSFFGLFFIVVCMAVASVFSQQMPAASSTPAASSSTTQSTTTQSTPSSGSARTPSANAQSTPAQSTAQTGNQKASPDLIKPSLPPGFDPKTKRPLYETIQEDWSSLDPSTSQLAPVEPIIGGVDEQDTFKRVLVQVKWRPGDAIDLWLVFPKDVKKPPAVLYLYGAGEGTSRFRENDWCKKVTSHGVAAVGFVAALTGHRFHDRPLDQWFISEMQESLGSTVHDVKFILDYLAQRGDIDMSRIGMFGEGYGGSIAILAAAADPRIKAVDTLEPWGDWPEFLANSPVLAPDTKRADYVKPEFLKRVAPLDPVKWLPNLKTPIRLQQVQDSLAMPMECKESVKNAAPKQTEVVRFARFTELANREGQGRLFDWIKTQLQEGVQPGAGSQTGKSPVAVKTVTASGADDQKARP